MTTDPMLFLDIMRSKPLSPSSSHRQGKWLLSLLAGSSDRQYVFLAEASKKERFLEEAGGIPGSLLPCKTGCQFPELESCICAPVRLDERTSQLVGSLQHTSHIGEEYTELIAWHPEQIVIAGAS